MKISFFKSITWKLAMLLFGIIALTLIAVLVSFLITAKQVLDEDVRENMETRGRKIANLISQNLEEGGNGEIQIELETLASTFEVDFAVIKPDGEIIYQSDKETPLTIKPDKKDLEKIGRGEDVYRVIHLHNDKERIAYSIFPVETTGGEKRAVIMGVSHSQPPAVRQKFNRHFTRIMLFTAGIAFLLAIVAAGNMTKQLRKMAQTAEKISRGDFSERIDSPRSDEIGQLAASMDEMSEQIEKNIQNRMKLTADISHELRTPTAAIRGTAEAIKDGVVNEKEEVEEYIDRIISQSERLTLLISDLTTLSKFETGEIKMKFRPFEPGSVVKRAIESIKPAADSKGIDIITEFEIDDGTKVEGDPDRILQVIQNLLNNAVQHNPEGTGVTVSLNRVGKEVRFSVRDSGMGIPEEDLPDIFNRFHKADKSRTRNESGSGLGLAIVKEIAEAHGSSVDVKSDGNGTVFSFCLKIVNA